MQQEHGRQRAGNQQQIIEPRMEKRQVRMRLDFPSVERLQRAADQEKRIGQIAEPSHSVQMMISPDPSPITTLSTTLMMSAM